MEMAGYSQMVVPDEAPGHMTDNSNLTYLDISTTSNS
jgi:hypothetical protein